MDASNASWFFLAIVAILLGGAVGTLAVVLRTPIRLTQYGARIVALETSQAHLEAEVKKALRRQGIAAKKAKAGVPVEEEGIDVASLLDEAGAPRAAPQRNGPRTLDDVRRAIAARRG